MNENNEPTTNPTPQPTTPVPAPPAPAQPVNVAAPLDDNSPKSYLATFLFAAFLIPMGVSRAYMGESSTWFKVAIIFYGIMLVPFIGVFIAAPVLFVLTIIGLIDFFKVYALRNNLAQHNLVASAKDLRYSKIIYTIYVVIFALYALLIVGVLVAAISGSLALSEFVNEAENNRSAPSTFELNDYR